MREERDMGVRRGVGIPKLGLLALVALLTALALPSLANASTTRPQVAVITGSSTGVTLHYPYGIGVDEATGNIFVSDGGIGAGTNVVDIFDAEGGKPVGVSSPYKFSGGFAFGKTTVSVPVDNAAGSPSKGAVYVTDGAHSKVKKYVLNTTTHLYELAGELTPTDGSTLSAARGLAIDSEGNVIVPRESGNFEEALFKFSPTGAQLAQLKGRGSLVNAVALDASGNLLYRDFYNENYGGDVLEYVSDGAGWFLNQKPISTFNLEVGQSLSDGIAIDTSRNELFVALTDRVVQYDAATFAKEGEFGIGALERANGIAVNQKTDRVYVSDAGATKRVVVFGAEVITPSVTTEAATAITPIAATIHGKVNPEGLAVSECKLEYLSQPDFLKNDPSANVFNETGGRFDGPNAPTVKPCGALPTDSADHPVSAALTGLATDTTYHFRIKAANANGRYISPEKTFKTPNPVATDSATEITGTRARLNATISPHGLPVTECHFEYRLSETPGVLSAPCEGAVPADEGTHAVSADISGLAPNGPTSPTTGGGKSYAFHVVATVGGATATGAEKSFNTAKTVKTEAASGVTGTQATLNGSVEPEGTTVSECRFEYGLTTGYGSSIPCEGSIPADESAHVVSAALNGLTPNSTYHFRLLAKVNGTTVPGGDRQFTLTQNVATLPATGVGAEAATLNGEVNPDGVPLDECVFEYGTTTAFGQGTPCVPGAEEIGSGTSLVAVAAKVSLQPGTTYHFRLRVHSANGTALGEDRSFQTPGPSIAIAWAQDVLRSEATLGAEIDPEGAATTYRFEWGASTAYGHSSPELEVGSDSVAHIVTRVLEGLEPGATYHYRVVATNAAAVSESPDRTFTTFRTATSETGCPNQAYRIGPAAALPDCRAYEMVSPVDKEGANILALPQNGNLEPTAVEQSATSGDRFTYGSFRAFGDAESASYTTQYTAARDLDSGWHTHAITPAQGKSIKGALETDFEFRAFSPDLCQSWVMPLAEPILAEGAAPGYINLYRRTSELCGPVEYEAVSRAKPENYPEFNVQYRPELQGFSEDGAVAAFVANDSLEGTGAPGGKRLALYVKGPGAAPPRYACILPGGAPLTSEACSAGSANSGWFMMRAASVKNALSADGKRLYWSDSSSDGRIYLRENPLGEGAECGGPGAPCTIDVSRVAEEAEATKSSHFWGAAEDGSVAIFGSGKGLYEFEVAGEATRKIAGGLYGVMGANADASRVYFVSGEAIVGSGENSEGSEAIAGRPNIYLYEAGGSDYRFVGTLAVSDVTAGLESRFLVTAPQTTTRVATVNDSGLQTAFLSSAPMTGYDNTDVSSPAPCGQESGVCDNEVFLYDAGANGGEGKLVCASCNPSGGRPAGRTVVSLKDFEGGWVTARLPRAETTLYARRGLSDDGSRLFFESQDPLTPSDSNGRIDVYEWEAPGSGSCDESSPSYSFRNGGCVSLVSSGQSDIDSRFVDANPDGHDAFFATGESLLPQDPGLVDIYDARVGGGFAQPQPLVACEGEACQGTPEAPNDPTPASESFEGAGNVHEEAAPVRKSCAKGKVRRHGKCVARKHKKAARRAKHRRRAGR